MGKINKTFKYKLKLSRAQESLFVSWLDTTRLIYNMSKTVNEYNYRAIGKTLSAFDLQNQIIDMKKDYHWMMELPKDTLTEPSFRFQKSLEKFFRGSAKYPKWAKKKFWNSLVFKQTANVIKIQDNRIKLQKGIILKFFNSRNLSENAKIKQVVLTKEVDGWYASIMFETELQNIKPANDNQVVGVDWGVVNFITLSDGKQIENPRWFSQYKDKLKLEQQKLAVKKKGSSAYKKQVTKLAKLHKHISRKRLDWQHKLSLELVKDYSGFVVEDLSINNMTKKGSGRNVLNREILSAAPYQFLLLLKYKSLWNDRYFSKIDPSYTSQTCSKCGHVDKDNRKTQANFSCVKCGHTENADLNAAKVIKGRDTAISEKLNSLDE